MKKLFLITGAGASHDVIDTSQITVKPSFQSPLTKNLFIAKDTHIPPPYSIECLANHPQVAQIGYEFYSEVREGKIENSLEQYLVNLKKSPKINNKSRFWAVPLYLFDLFMNVSFNYLPTSEGLPSNYQFLINVLNESIFKEIIWLNLNYDLLADFAIKFATQNPLNNFDDYMGLHTKDGLYIKYTKPHGSIDWYKELREGIKIEDIRLGNVEPDLEKFLTKQIFKFHDPQLRLHYSKKAYLSKRYPAITAPIGEYEYIYQQHIDSIKGDLKSTNDVLCIGFGGLDKDILDLIDKFVVQIDRLMIVNGTKDAGVDTYQRIKQNCRNTKINAFEESSVFDGGFTKFIKSGIKRWVGVM